MKPYQITLILKDQKDTAEIDKTIGQMGEILKNQLIGQKTLVYPIKKQTIGFFYRVDVNLEADKIGELRQTLLRQPEVLRYILSYQPAPNIAPMPRKIVDKAIRQLAEKEAKKAVSEVSEEPVTKKVEKPKIEVAEKSMKLEEKERQKILDEKLKELLEE
jgi:ribosomal protein S6